MNGSFQFRRLLLLASVLGLAFAGLIARLVYLQVFRQDDLGAEAVDNTVREIIFEPRRGDILDAKGNLLATSPFVKTVCADPTLIGNQQAVVARALAPLLELNEAELRQRLQLRLISGPVGTVKTNRYSRYVVLRRKVSFDVWQKIQQTMAGLNFGYDERSLRPSQRLFLSRLRQKAILTEGVDDQLRIYPHGRLAAHVLGGVGNVETNFAGHKILELAGVDGVERTMNSKLSGIRGWRQTEIDVRQREQVALRGEDVEPHDGLSVVLTIDSVIQNKVEEALAQAMREHTPVSASAIVVRPRTGQILAMANLPDFDPNQPGRDMDARRNRLITDIHEPGSTFKIVVVSGALNSGAVTLQTRVNCENGAWSYAGYVLHDHEKYGWLTVQEVIMKSSNIGAAKIALLLGETNLYHYMTDFGIGQRTGLPLLGEQGGILKFTNWTKLSISRIAMGHEVAVTPLQMVMAMCAIANHGVLMKPMLVDRLQDAEGQVVVQMEPQPVRRVFGEAAARDMVQALKTVVSTNGTAEKAKLDNYIAAGKTGTAQKAGIGGYQPGKYFSSFIGFFPADNPELCIAVFLDEPREGYYGGKVAAPIFKQIAEYAANYLNIPPDIPPADPAATATNRVLRTAAVLPRAGTFHD